MVKFVVVCYRRRDWSREQFRRYFRDVHGPLAMAMPGVRRYVQNFVEADERLDPPWDAVIEFWFDDRASMEAAWQSEAGQRASGDNANLMDLERTRWGVVEEIVVRDGAAGNP
ncbi:MAG: EthD family reductase [Candidatus Binatia bacterium]